MLVNTLTKLIIMVKYKYFPTHKNQYLSAAEPYFKKY